MAIVCKMISLYTAFVLLFSIVFAAPPRGFFDDVSTSTQISLEEDLQRDGGRNSIWDEGEDVFDLDGDSWLNQSPAGPLSTWPSLNQSPKPSFEEGDGGMIEDDEDESDDDDQDGDPSEFLLVPEVKADDDKRIVKSRHEAIPEVNPEEGEDDSSEKDNLNYDFVSDAENNDEPEDILDNDIFGDRNDGDSKKLLEDKVFLF